VHPHDRPGGEGLAARLSSLISAHWYYSLAIWHRFDCCLKLHFIKCRSHYPETAIFRFYGVEKALIPNEVRFLFEERCLKLRHLIIRLM